MNEPLPPPVMKNPTGSEANLAGGRNAAPISDAAALPQALSADSAEGQAPFLDAFEHVLGTFGEPEGQTGTARGGKALPPGLPAAASGPQGPVADAADEQREMGTAVTAGLWSQSLMLAPDQADAAAQAVARTDSRGRLSMQGPNVERVQAGAEWPLIGGSAPTSPTTQASNRAEILAAATEPLAATQADAAGSLLLADAVKRTTAARPGPMLAPGHAAAVDGQPQTTVPVIETDRLFASQMQQAALTQAAEPAGNRQALETLLNTTHAASNEAMPASLTRLSTQPPAPSADAFGASSSQPAINEAFGRPEWGQGMGKQVLWMVNQSISRAEIRLNPANLGPLEVRIDMENDQVNLVFSSRHAEVREAVEQALPRLREMLEEKGLNLAEANVSQHTFAEQRDSGFAGADDYRGKTGSGAVFPAGKDPHADGLVEPRGQTDGLIDYYI